MTPWIISVAAVGARQLTRMPYFSPSMARADVFDYIERFCNPMRRHSTLGYLSPIYFGQSTGVA
ncbi:hypothetical protein FBZ90_1292 [Nitrospirillum pindoramense]|uniref:Integrase-like protein n=1 Tax=Nitrospirillum amazonense TaxID=28077 RepID=A0A560GIU9_9PROT|nr:hypothetical protein FBZ90_1292 [Nitrospirillum amazonense]